MKNKTLSSQCLPFFLQGVVLCIMVLSPFVNGAEPSVEGAPPAAPAASELQLVKPELVKPAAEAPPKIVSRPRRIVVEKSIYLPYEKLKEIFEKEGRGIFLPYEEFLRLWREANKKPPDKQPEKPPAPAVIRGGAYRGAVKGDIARFTVDFTIEALQKGWCELDLPLKGVALEEVKLSNPAAMLRSKGDGYSVLLPDRGTCTASLTFSVRITKQPGRQTISFKVPPVAVSKLELSVPEPDVQVDVSPVLAVTTTDAKEKETIVHAFLGNVSDVSISWMPPPEKRVKESAVLLASQSIHAYLGRRILRIATDITFQVMSGETDTLRIEVPEKTRLLSVKGDNIRERTVDENILTVTLHAPLKGGMSGSAGGGAAGTDSYRLSLNFERILEQTPESLSVPFPVVQDVMRESGWVVLGHDSALKVRIRQSEGLSQLDKNEVPKQLHSHLGTGFRYLAQPLQLAMDVEEITPVIHSFTTSVVSLGTEDDTWFGWIDYTIKKTGVFRLKLRFPAQWDIVSVGDRNSVEDFQVEKEGDTQTVTVDLKSKALGGFRLPFQCKKDGSASEGELVLSPPVVPDTQQDRGLFGISAPKAFRVSTVEKTKMTAEDVDKMIQSGIMNRLAVDAGLPLTYAYRETGASVKVELKAKQTEIDVLCQHLVEMTGGTIKLTHMLDFQVLYAAVDTLQFSAPAELDDVLKVEAKEMKELRKTGTEKGRTQWEMVLQAPALGAVSVTMHHTIELKALEPGKPYATQIPLIRPIGANEVNGFVAVRKEGTVQVDPRQSGMEVIEAADLPDKLRRGQIYSAFRYFTETPSLGLEMTRYEFQPLAKAVVNLLYLKAVVNDEKLMKAQAVFMMQNTDRQYLEIKLSDGVNILSVSVAGTTQKPRKRGKDTDTWLIQIPSSAGPKGTFPVVVVYEEQLPGDVVGTFGRVQLRTPGVLGGVPVGKIELDLYISPDYTYVNWSGMNLKFAGKQSLWERFKAVVNNMVQAQNRETPVSRQLQQGEKVHTGGVEAALSIAIPTRGYVLHRFETLRPRGELRFLCIDRTSFSFLDFAGFLIVLGITLFLLFKTGVSKLVAAIAVLFIPLACIWFSSGAWVELFSSFLLGGAVGFAGFFVAAAKKKIGEIRRERLMHAPDPYLEDAEPREKKTAGSDAGDAEGAASAEERSKVDQSKEKPENLKFKPEDAGQDIDQATETPEKDGDQEGDDDREEK